jgi:biopolymer transport protein ExbD
MCGAACQRGSGTAKGFMVDLATSAESCGDSRTIVAVAVGRHRAKLNAEPDATFPEVVQRLREVMSYRAEKVVYVKAEAEVSWGEFLELVGDVWPEVNAVSILTPQVEAMARRTYCLGPSCRDCTKFGGFPTRTR